MKAVESPAIEIVQKLREYFLKQSSYPFVLLFGSFASGESAPSSDIDLGIYVGKEPDYLGIGLDVANLESLLSRRIDITVLDGLEGHNPLLAFEILRKHKLLILRDEESYIAFKTRAQLSYLDALPLIEANRKALQKRIENRRIGERNFVTAH